MEKVPDERSEAGHFYLAHLHRMAEHSEANPVFPTLPAMAHACDGGLFYGLRRVGPIRFSRYFSISAAGQLLTLNKKGAN
jgi:hypothetical protein